MPVNSLPAGRGRIGSGRPCPDGSRARPRARGRPHERHRDRERHHGRLVLGAGPAQDREQVEQRSGAEEDPKQPNRQIAVMAALHGNREFRIGKARSTMAPNRSPSIILATRWPRISAAATTPIASRTSGGRCGRESR